MRKIKETAIKRLELSDHEMEILIKGYDSDYDAYYKELESRRDYLKWYTSMFAAGVVLSGYLLQQNSMPLTIVVLAALFVLGVGTFRVMLASSITALYSFVRFTTIHRYLISVYPTIAVCCPPHELSFNVKGRANFISLLRMPLPHVLRIVILINSIVCSCLSAVCAWVFIKEQRPLFLCLYAAVAFLLVHMSQRLMSVGQYHRSKELLLSTSRNKGKEVREDEKKEQSCDCTAKEEGEELEGKKSVK